MASNLVKRLAVVAVAALLAAPLAAQQLPFDPTKMTDEELKKEMMFEPLQIGTISQPFFRGAPGTSSGSPSAFGAGWRDGFVGGGVQQARQGGSTDGSMAAGFGLGNAKDAVGLEVVMASLSTFRSGLFERTGFSFKAHHMVSSSASIALGVENALITGSGTDTKATVYLAASKVIVMAAGSPMAGKNLTLSGGLGNGRFRFEKDALADKSTVNFFGSVGLQVHKQASVLADWGGQDLTLGLSFVPIPAFPIIITPAIADVTGQNGNDPRFTLGFGIGMRF